MRGEIEIIFNRKKCWFLMIILCDSLQLYLQVQLQAGHLQLWTCFLHGLWDSNRALEYLLFLSNFDQKQLWKSGKIPYFSYKNDVFFYLGNDFMKGNSISGGESTDSGSGANTTISSKAEVPDSPMSNKASAEQLHQAMAGGPVSLQSASKDKVTYHMLLLHPSIITVLN